MRAFLRFRTRNRGPSAPRLADEGGGLCTSSYRYSEFLQRVRCECVLAVGTRYSTLRLHVTKLARQQVSQAGLGVRRQYLWAVGGQRGRCADEQRSEDCEN